MSERYPGGIISKTPPTITGPTDGEGGSASGMWNLTDVAENEKAGTWPKRIIPRLMYTSGIAAFGVNGQNDGIIYSSPVQLGSDEGWSDISSNGLNQYAIKNGEMYAWGIASDGSLGDNQAAFNRSSPVQIGAGLSWASVNSSGVSSSTTVAAITDNGELYTWGSDGGIGALGHNSIGDKSSPTQVGALTNWLKVVPSESSGCIGIKTDGTLWSWGANLNGEVGDNTKTSKSSPVQIGSDTDWADCARADQHSSYAIKTDGSLYVWGRNPTGELGTNDRVFKSSPVQIASDVEWSSASGAYYGAFAIDTSNRLWVIGGYQNEGEFGLGDRIRRSSPVQVGALTNWSSVNSETSTVAIKTDGTLWAWGAKTASINNDAIWRSSPIQIGSETGWDKVDCGQDRCFGGIIKNT